MVPNKAFPTVQRGESMPRIFLIVFVGEVGCDLNFVKQ